LDIEKESRNKSKISGQRLKIDISYACQPDGTQTGKNWIFVVDEITSMM
jgi:hypothetical protein